ncbi:replication endonuclease [Pectobacterium sp. FL60-S17]|uniref:Replication endonuclease n=1 Tax=Pectobacterium quasiaquaticum TaxID=2774015 RepID=A0A9Q2EQY0_9GAMM|nr:replication endonuclease [Pectobacterium quasiaquaticum]MBE5202013.1 replication endonuclease [Pectobacterium quasiaquaticum]MBE5208844.1 replication endonuclease [Pectobacterium quasiaquaticum]MBE5223091.1 replication endonuclease [Pectobacterium quasiaquaticum]URG50838.1 replication endonuclease [Pectobacterium quasiaquaticum]
MITQRLAIADKNFSHLKKLGKFYSCSREGCSRIASELADEFSAIIGDSDIEKSINASFKNIFTKNYYSADFDELDILVFDEKLNFSLSALRRETDFLNPKKIHIPQSRDFFENSVFMRVARAVSGYGLDMPKMREVFDFLLIPFADWPCELQNIFYGALARVTEPTFWVKILWRIRCHWVGCRDTARNRVHKKISPYVSVRALREFASAQQRMNNFLENNELESSDGDRISLRTAYESGNSCPKNRRTELMTRLRHTGEYFTSEGYDGYFLTITLPSRYHPNHVDGRENRRCTVINPRVGQEELSRIWRNIHRKFARDGIFSAGFRMTEPNHDGTPHWHCVIWFRPEQAETALKIFHDRYCAQDWGAIAHNPQIRFQATPIDPERGAAAYCAAYVSKNIDGFGLDGDLEAGLSAADGATRATAWARLYGIRQFQSFGCVGATAWREFRRLRKSPDCDPVLRDFWQAADSGDFGAFIRLSRQHGGVSLYRADADFAGHELRNQWGEKTTRIRGVCLSVSPMTRLQTRSRDWTIVPKTESESESVSVTVRPEAVRACGTLAPWTSGNNCPHTDSAVQADSDFFIHHTHNNNGEAPDGITRLRI